MWSIALTLAPTTEPQPNLTLGRCDMWSIGVLLYVMLSKTMPFRAKEVDQLLKQVRPCTPPHTPARPHAPTRTPLPCHATPNPSPNPHSNPLQVVKGKFAFKPEDRWRNVSPVAKDLISQLLVVEPAKRLTVQQVREHPWCAEAVKKCAANLPQIKPKSKAADQGKSSGSSVGGFNVPASLASSIPSWARLPRGSISGASGGTGPKKSLVHRIPKGKSREQQYWCAALTATLPPHPHPSPLTPHPSPFTPHPSPLTPHPSALSPQA